MFERLDFGPGKICFCSDELWKEDVLQVEYPGGYILDLGWYGEKNGFSLYIIKDHNWERPVKKHSFLCKSEIEDTLRIAVEEIKELLEEKTTGRSFS